MHARVREERGGGRRSTDLRKVVTTQCFVYTKNLWSFPHISAAGLCERAEDGGREGREAAGHFEGSSLNSCNSGKATLGDQFTSIK